jgi:muramidase (phage lysozyme)
MKRMILMALAALALVFSLSACSPAQVRAYMNMIAYWNKHNAAASPAKLASIRNCESRGNYSAVSANGRYRGAYQFNQSTWNGVASRHYPNLVGKDPARVAPYQQDAMALALISERGFSAWPHCG